MTLFVQDPTGVYSPASNGQIIKAALSVTQKAVRAAGPILSNPSDIKRFLLVRMSHLEHEIFAVVYLNTRLRFIAFDKLFRGTIDGSAVHPREVVKAALARNAAAVVLAHNHPSGDPEPSQADELITRRLKQVFSLIDMRVLDHIIVGHDACISFAERGLL